MMKKRIAAILALAIVSTVSPLMYQYVIEPRVEGAFVDITIQGIEYNADESAGNMTAFTVYLKLENDQENDVIVSPLQLDMYYRSSDDDRYRLIGELRTNDDYVVPGTATVGKSNAYVASKLEGSEPERDDPNTKKYNEDKEIKAVLYFSKKSGFIDGTNEALVDLINNRENGINLIFKGDAQFGPISIPVETDKINLKAPIWDPELIINDIFLFRTATTIKEDIFILDTFMRNPSGIPLSLQDFELDLYNESGDQVGWGVSSEDAVNAYDPTETKRKLTEVYLDGAESFDFQSDDKWNWKHVFLAFNLTDPNRPAYTGNIEWFLSKLMDQKIITNLALKGPATILLGQPGKGFLVDMEEKDNYLELKDDPTTSSEYEGVTFYQKYINKYEDRNQIFTGKDPVKLFGNFTLGPLSVNKMDINTKSKDIRLDITAEMILKNPYRFEYTVGDFDAKFLYRKTTDVIANSSSPTINLKVWPAYRDLSTNQIISNQTNIPLNLTSTYNTDNPNTPIYKLIEDLGGNGTLLDLTNPFFINKTTNPTAYEECPINTIEYLIEKGVNPFTLLNEVELLRVTRDYYPLRGMFFGNSTRSASETSAQATINTEMPYLGGNWLATGLDTYGFFTNPDFTGDDWDDYYDGSTFENNLRKENQYEIVEYSFADGFFDDDEDNSMNTYMNTVQGIITEIGRGSSNQQHRDGSFANTPLSDVIWRIYESDYAGPNNFWGPMYDYFGYGDKGYYIGTYIGDGEGVHFAQDFTLDSDKFRDADNIINPDTIKSVTLGISYKYLDGYFQDPDTKNNTVLTFSFWNPTSDQYDYVGFGPDGSMPFGRYGYTLPQTTDEEWTDVSIDLTSEFKDRIQDYIDNGYSAEYLKAEAGFAAWNFASTTDPLRVAFDDIVLDIEYYDYPDASLNTSGMLNVEELFEYLNSVDSDEGNLFNMFYQLSEGAVSTTLDDLNWWEYLANENIIRNGDGAVDLFNYLQFRNVSFTTITDILQNRYRDLDIGEPANFLELLTQTKYRPVTAYVPQEDQTIVSTKYGPRVENTGNWVIEDGLNASRGLVNALYDTIFVDSSGDTTRNDFQGEELWYMFERLGVTLPWIVMYLLSHGWTKDDVYDLLEALGFGAETKYQFDDDIDEGILRTYIQIDGSGVAGIFTLHDFITVELDMDPVLDDGVQELYSVLCSAGTRYLVDNHGDVVSAPYYYRVDGDVWFIGITLELWIDVLWFEIEIAVNPDPNHLIQTPYPTPPLADFPRDYINLGTGSGRGLNDAGTKQLASNLRANFQFNGQPYITNGGDPISLFQFLDTYYFYKVDDVDYSSLSLLTYFNCSGVDFVDIITGYDAELGIHDPNGNGKADDWRAPLDYTEYNKNNLLGWGTSFRHNRLFWNTNQYPLTGQENGAIIWSDSPDFTTQSTIHQNGNIEVGSLPAGDRINQTAPPLVNLWDMMYWISEASGNPDPYVLTQWLLGELNSSFYQMVDPRGGEAEPGEDGFGKVSENDIQQMTNQEVWRMFRKSGLNSIGFFNWLDEKSINSFQFLYLLQNITNKFNPLDLLFFATNQHLIRFEDGAIAYYHHDALDSQGTIANDVLWEFFSSSSFNPLGFFRHLNSKDFEIFEMFMALQVDPASWLKVIDNKYNTPGGELSPIEIIMRMKKADIGENYLNLDEDGSTVVNVYANITLKYQSITIKSFPNQHIGEDKELTTAIHFQNFIDTKTLRGDKFIIR